ncbi:MAG: hypothetical protein E7377_00780, partial [Clostridiales bacterium]|nr:hypothetical protein [Clostridiales bacterium]
MEDKKELENLTESVETEEVLAIEADTETPLDKNIKLMSPTRMILRRFFRSKLSVVGLIMLASLFLFCWLGPVFYHQWTETESDRSGAAEYSVQEVRDEVTGEILFVQMIVTDTGVNMLAGPSADHLLGTDEQGMDIFTRLMYGGRLSLTISFLAVFLTSALGIILGGVAGYYGGIVDNIIMRLC